MKIFNIIKEIKFKTNYISIHLLTKRKSVIKYLTNNAKNI